MTADPIPHARDRKTHFAFLNSRAVLPGDHLATAITLHLLQ